MFCTNTCLLAIIFIVTKVVILFTITLPYNNSQKDLNNSLDQKQKEAYKKIISERRSIYIKGYLVGIILSIIVILVNLFVFKQNKVNT